MSNPLALSHQSRLTFSHFGMEGLPLVAVESALNDPERVIQIASQHAFRQHGEFYPGLRAPVSEAVAMPLVAPILDQLEGTFTLDRVPRFSECYLSVVTHAPGNLAPIQRLPHFDGVERERLAVLLYLDRLERGGTAFYRQRVSGFESVDADRFENYRSTLEAEIDRDGLPDPHYIAGDTASFEQIHTVPGLFNSMVIYRGNTLHCAALPRDFVPDPSPLSGRLTLNLFLD